MGGRFAWDGEDVSLPATLAMATPALERTSKLRNGKNVDQLP